MAEHERETTVVHTGGGGAGWFVAGLILIGVLVGGYFLLGGSFDGDKDINVKIETPKVDK